MSQFAFLQAEFPDIFAHAARAENLAHTDPRAAAFYCRLALETAVDWLYRHDRTLKDPYEPTLAAHLAEPTFQTLVGRTLAVKARFVKDTGNAAAHGKPVSAAQAATSLREFFHIAYWLARTYARGREAASRTRRSASRRCRASPQVAATTLAQLQEVGPALRGDGRGARRGRERAPGQRGRPRGAGSRDRGAAGRDRRRQGRQPAVADTHDYNEAETRDRFIDLLLREAGWSLDSADTTASSRSPACRTRTGEGFVDYVLLGRRRQAAGAGRGQAHPQATRASASSRPSSMPTAWRRSSASGRSSSTPTATSTGSGTTRAIRRGRSRAFYKKDELELLIQRRADAQAAGADGRSTATIVERHYQHRAIRRIAEAFERDKQRKALLVMATGAARPAPSSRWPIC